MLVEVRMASHSLIAITSETRSCEVAPASSSPLHRLPTPPKESLPALSRSQLPVTLDCPPSSRQSHASVLPELRTTMHEGGQKAVGLVALKPFQIHLVQVVDEVAIQLGCIVEIYLNTTSLQIVRETFQLDLILLARNGANSLSLQESQLRTMLHDVVQHLLAPASRSADTGLLSLLGTAFC